MAEKIKTAAVLCALPEELLALFRALLRNKPPVTDVTAHLGLGPLLLRYKNIETMEAHNREEMLALLETHTFRGMVTVSSWLPEEEVMARNERSDVPSIEGISALILVEPQHNKYIPARLTSIENMTNHDWVDMPFVIEEVILRLGSLGILPKK